MPRTVFTDPAPRDDEEGLRRELEHHVDLLASDFARSGLPAREARRRALIAFGGLEQVKEQCRDVRHEFRLARVARALRATLRRSSL